MAAVSDLSQIPLRLARPLGCQRPAAGTIRKCADSDAAPAPAVAAGRPLGAHGGIFQSLPTWRAGARLALAGLLRPEGTSRPLLYSVRIRDHESQKAAQPRAAEAASAPEMPTGTGRNGQWPDPQAT